MPYDIGDTVTDMWGTVKDANGVPTNSTSTTLTLHLPDGTTTTLSTSNPSTGVYGSDYVPMLAGPYDWDLISSNPAAALGGSFYVRPDISAAFTSLSDAKTQLNMSPATATYDEELRQVIEAAAEVVERVTRTSVTRRTRTDYPHACSSNVLYLNYYPVFSITSVRTIDGLRTWNVSDLHVVPTTGRVTVINGLWFSGDLEIVYVAGRAAIPATYLEAAEVIVQHLWELKRPDRGGARPGGLDEATTLVPGFSFAIPKRALELLGPTPPLVA